MTEMERVAKLEEALRRFVEAYDALNRTAVNQPTALPTALRALDTVWDEARHLLGSASR